MPISQNHQAGSPIQSRKWTPGGPVAVIVVLVLFGSSLFTLWRVEKAQEEVRALNERVVQLESRPATSASRPGQQPNPNRHKWPADATEFLTAQEVSRGIRRISASEFIIEHAFFQRLVSGKVVLATYVRLIPETDDDPPSGVKIYGIRSGSVVGRLGIENGDILLSIAGLPVTSKQDVVTAYESLRDLNDFDVSILRRRKEVTMRYSVE